MSLTADLEAFAFGELLEGTPPRSLGYRLLAPAQAAGWLQEVEQLARHLQAAPYPDEWPPAELFCSVLLADGRRLVAAARYGLTDHTASHRRGGLELLGVVGPARLDVPAALAIYRWLRQRRGSESDLRAFAGRHSLADVLAAAPAPHAGEPARTVPMFAGPAGTLFLTANAPADPDEHLGLLGQRGDDSWQWLPFVGSEFPVAPYARRGSLVAWSPLQTGAAWLNRAVPAERLTPTPFRSQGVALALAAALLLQTGGLLAFYRQAQTSRPAVDVGPPEPAQAAANPEATNEAFALALHRLLQNEHALEEWDRSQLAQQYERLSAQDGRLRTADPNGQAAVGAVGLLARRRPERIEAAIREALTGKGYDPELIDLACRRVRERLAENGRKAR